MDNSANMLQLCRLCLVKEQVNIPIFEEQGDIRRIFQKISSCLPVKVSRDDKLPKKICDGCSYKLDICYEFWNTSANSEKQLLTWLGDLGVKNDNKISDSSKTSSSHSTNKHHQTDAPVVKKEEIDLSDAQDKDDDEDDENKAYMFQQKLEESNSSSGGPSATVTTNNEDESPPPKRQRRTAAVKAAIAMDHDSDDDDDSGEPLTKIEDETDDSDGDDNDPSFVDVPSTSADDQPGPSGVGKDNSDAPSKTRRKGKLIEQKTEEDTLEDKLLSHTIPKERILLFACELCGENFKTSIDLAVHSVKHSDDKKYYCHHCNFKTKQLKNIKRHMLRHGNDGKQYNCEMCKMSFPESKQAIEHKNVHTVEMPFQCFSCEKYFMFSWLLFTHLRLFHSGEQQLSNTVNQICHICHIKFNTNAALRKHILRKHREQTKPLCDVCGKCLSSNESLKFHRRLHTGEKPHKCATCGKSFAKKGLLIGHERTHTGEKPYSCLYCKKRFAQRPPLSIHQRIHTGERPYVCRLCTKGFICKSVLDNHMRICPGLA